MHAALLIYLLSCAANGVLTATKPYEISLSASKLEDIAEYKYSSGYEFNRFELFLADASMMDDAFFFIVLESESPDFVLAFFDDPMTSGAVSTPILELKTNSGNLVFGTNSNFYSSKLESFHLSGILRLAVISNKVQPADAIYKLRFVVAKELNLLPNKAYTSYLDPTMNALKINYSYNGSSYKSIKKLRFQLTVIHKKADFTLNADLEHKESLYELNGLFGHIVGGVLNSPFHDICTEAICKCQLKLKMLRVRSLNIEFNIIEDVEKISLAHFEEYYDRVYDENKTEIYELPFDKLASGLDVTFTLIAVSGVTGLYINAITLPASLEKYDWKEKGPMAKRITVQNSDLIQMKAENSTLFVAVSSSQPGEYLLRIDAHDKNFRGRLMPGIIEAGYLNPESLVNYIYYFEAYETQAITFEINLNLITGDADLFLKACPLNFSCRIGIDDLKNQQDVIKAQSALSSKKLSYNFKCEVKKKEPSTRCSFAVALNALGSQKTYFELSLVEGDFHRLMHPGHEAHLTLKADKKVYLKFSNSPHREARQSLFFQIYPHYGSFSVHLNKGVKFPSNETSIISRNIVSTKAGLYNAMQTIEITDDLTDDQSVYGIYYITVEATTACSLSLKFFVKYNQDITIHSLTPGSELRGQLSSPKELAYYTIKVNPETAESSGKIAFNLTPLKGSFMMYLSSDGSLPNKKSHLLSSQDHHLEVDLLVGKNQNQNQNASEFILGVQVNDEALDPSNRKSKNADYQFYISCRYSSRPLRLTTGVISGHIIKEENMFAIEILNEMNDLLIIKGMTDGLNVSVCLQFSTDEVWIGEKSECKSAISARQSAVYLEKNQLTEGCKALRTKDAERTCYILLAVSGNQNQKVQLGFTYNGHPFKLIKNILFTLPIIRRSDAQIRMIFHAEQNQPISINTNSKGHDLSVFSRLVREDHFQDQDLMSFPTKEIYDAGKQNQRGYVTQIFYNANEVADFGKSPEILISITSAASNTEGASFDPNFYFTIQTTMETKEIQRTQILSDNVEEKQWNYYTFFNNGNSASLRVYVCATVSSALQVLLSKGFQSRPPFTNEPLLAQNSLASVELVLRAEDLDIETRQGPGNGLRGYYTVAVKSSGKTTLNLFWNNKEDLNYIELSPNIPTTMTMDKEKNLYFSFYAKKPDDTKEWPDARVTFYIKTNVRANFYVLKSQTELMAPSSENYKWKVSLGAKGGITSLRITPKDPDYCSNCLYIGYLDNVENGQVSVLATFNYSNDPIELVPGFTIPDELSPNEKIVYRIFNSDNDLIDLTTTMLNGFVNVYLSDKSDVSEANFVEKFELGETLETQKMIIIAPFRYNITEPHDYFVLLHNPRLTSASFTMSVDKNSLKSPIEPGMTKVMHLAPGESTDFYYTPSEKETLFEVKFELRQVLNEPVRQQSLELIGDYIELYHMDIKTNSRYKLAYIQKIANKNRVYISFDIKESSGVMFFLHIYNPVGSSILATVDLLNGGYKMLSYNEFLVDQLPPKGKIIYEGYGEASKLFFIDLKTCYGNINVEFFQGDYESVARNKSVEFKEIKNDNNVINYITLNSTKAFVRLTNKQDEVAVYQLGVFTEKDLQGNPYSDLAQGNGGKVEIESERRRIVVPPARIKSTGMEEFRHLLTYTLFLAGDLRTMRYAKNCGDYMVDQVLDEPFLIKQSLNYTFNSLKELDEFNQQVVFEMIDYPSRSKLYGVVVATIELFPKDESFFSPLRVGRVYYDEFIYKTPLLHIPTKLVVATLLFFALFTMIFLLLKNYAFGEISHLEYFSRAGQLFKTPEITLELNLRSILESEYYENSGHANGGHGTEMTEKQSEQREADSGLTSVRL